MTTLPSSLDIAQRATLRPIVEVAAELGVAPDDLEPYGRYKAKLPLSLAEKPSRGQLILVTGINPTTAGEGKTTTCIGLVQALRRLGKRAIACLRQPSLGPVFGVKGGATGAGYSQVLPMADINLHFTGDFHAVSSAHALLSALLDNHLHFGNSLSIDLDRIFWPRAVDMNDRALRRIRVGVGGGNYGVERSDRFVITSASEVMAVLALARDLDDLQARLSRIVVGFDRGSPERAIRAADLGASGAMALLLRDALRPNLVQTLEGAPALVHAGPFANIAHGCSSLIATRTALAVSDYVVTEAGFGSDLGAEKFFDIKCRAGGLDPKLAVLVATVRALKLNGGADAKNLQQENLPALQQGLPNLARHIDNLRQFGVPVVVAVNRFADDHAAELACVQDFAAAQGLRVALSDVVAQGGAGGEALGQAVLSQLAEGGARYRPLYALDQPLSEKIQTIATKVYGADGVDYSEEAAQDIERLERAGLSGLGVCIAKTQYSFSDDPKRLGSPRGFRIRISGVSPAAGPGFVVARAGDIMTMPGLSKSPAALRMRLRSDGSAEGLF
ncbi:MAG: formate--tetrahydrofolate ligase [Myxococcales bacterium]|nr:formate--tetrahydrofolate ligase [Myxococcales bacterium]